MSNSLLPGLIDQIVGTALLVGLLFALLDAMLAGFKNAGFAEGIWWEPVVGPVVGGSLGGWVYDLLIGRTLKKQKQQKMPIAQTTPAITT